MKDHHMKNILLTIIILIIINKISTIKYPNTITLSNGNILIIDNDGIYIYDSSLENKIKDIYIFEEEDQITEEEFDKVITREMSSYIICKKKFKLFFLSKEGELVKSTKKLIEKNTKDFILVPLSEELCCYFIFGYFEEFDTIFHLNKYYINISKENEEPSCLYSEYTENIDRNPEEDTGLTCEFLLRDEEYCLLCLVNINNKIIQFVYTIEDSKGFIKNDDAIDIILDVDLKRISSIKSISNLGKDKAVVAITCELYYLTDSF